MKVGFLKHINVSKAGRVEFWLTNFDYIDGNKYLAKMFCDEFEMSIKETIDGIYFNTITLNTHYGLYQLLWHEDIGNVVYSEKQDTDVINKLEEQLGQIVAKLNLRLFSI